MQDKVFKVVRPYINITIGLFIFAFGWTAFLIPSKITGGGISGLASIVFFATEVPVALTYFVTNIFLLLLATKFLGFGYSLKTVYGVSVVSLFFGVLQGVFKEPLVNEPFMATVLGGIISGIGTGMVFNGGGSTGGTDIIAAIANKYRGTPPGRVLLLCDFVIIGSSFLIFRSIEKVVYGLSAMTVATFVIDLMINGFKQSVQFMIISKEYAVIADRFNVELDRGVTVLDGTGWYSKEPVKILMLITKKNQVRQVMHIVRESDPNAFISQGTVMGAYGIGFESIKS